MAILIVEDEDKIAGFIKRGLHDEGYEVDHAPDGESALLRIRMCAYDVIVLDVMLPDADGMALCRKLRGEGLATPIIMLTARDSVGDKVSGLNAGADDYLTKPFAFEEFLARIRALMRKHGPMRSAVLQVEDLSLDQVTHQVTRAGQSIELSNKEYALLEYLMLNAGQVLTRAVISQRVWNIDFDTYTNVIDVFINYLRKKIDDPFERHLIKTIRGRGYGIGVSDQ
jgi:DNA-binding response OmpR family regulator